MILIPEISLHVTVGLVWLRCCHISISLFMSAHISLSLNEILLALSITRLVEFLLLVIIGVFVLGRDFTIGVAST